MIKRSYKELIRFKTFEERYNYLKLIGSVGQSTFGFDRYLNQALYNSEKWRKVRREVIIRDNGFDLGINDMPISSKIIIHHMNPITEEDILNQNEEIFDPNYLICVSERTHNAIHYSTEKIAIRICLYRKKTWRYKAMVILRRILL